MYENCEAKMGMEQKMPRETMTSVIIQTQETLKELLLRMGDTSMQLFADGNITNDGPDKPERKCAFDDARIVRNQAIAALQSFSELREKLL